MYKNLPYDSFRDFAPITHTGTNTFGVGNQTHLAPEFKEALLKQGTETVGSTPEQFAAHIKSEANKYSRVIKRAGLEFTQ